MLGEVRWEEKFIFFVKMRQLGGVSYRIHCQQFTCNTTLTGGGGGGGGGGDSPE